MDEKAETDAIVLKILDFLKTEYHKSSTTNDAKESIEVAMQCLETAFNTNLSEQQCRVKTPLRELFRSYNATASNPLFGSQNPLAQLFGEMGQPGAAGPAAARAPSGDAPINMENTTGSPYEQPPEASPEQKSKADDQKNAGNDCMKNGDFTGALNAYNEAINLDGRNAVYFCNRAAAYQKLNQLDKALRDCQIACQLQPDYARAYGRMGVTYSTMGDHQKASACYRKAVELEPSNESYANNLKVSEEVLASVNSGGYTPPQARSQAALHGIFNNPSLINMATQMLQDPNMQNMMRVMMGDLPPPDAGDQMNMNGLFQVGEAMANQIRMSNPELVEQLATRLGQVPGGQQPPGNQPTSGQQPPSENQ